MSHLVRGSGAGQIVVGALLVCLATGCSTKPLAVLPYDGPHVTAAAFSGDGSRLVSGSSDGFLRIWDVPGGRELARWRAFHALQREPLRVTVAAMSPDGQYAAFAVTGSNVYLWA